MAFNFNYLSDLNEILYSNHFKDGEYSGDNKSFQISDAMPIIRPLVRVISDIKVNCNYLSGLDEMVYTKQLKDDECNDDNYFLNFYRHAYK